ncbi:MAG: transposase [Mycobacterium sp.]
MGLETMLDRVHAVVEVHPQLGIRRLLKALKARLSRVVHRRRRSITTSGPTARNLESC